MEDPKEIVRGGYDALGDQYFEARKAQAELLLQQTHFRHFMAAIPEGEAVLDAGCGPGVPYTLELSHRFKVTGIDQSRTQLELARRNVPEASFIHDDMVRYDAPDGSFAGIASLYAVIHIPCSEHRELFANFYRLLKPGGLMLVVLGSSAHEHDFAEDYYGGPMYWSSHDPAEAQALIESVGFEITRADLVIDDLFPDSKHLFVMARKG